MKKLIVLAWFIALPAFGAWQSIHQDTPSTKATMQPGVAYSVSFLSRTPAWATGVRVYLAGMAGGSTTTAPVDTSSFTVAQEIYYKMCTSQAVKIGYVCVPPGSSTGSAGSVSVQVLDFASGTVLASASVPIGSATGWHTAVLSDRVHLEVGKQYLLRVSTTQQGVSFYQTAGALPKRLEYLDALGGYSNATQTNLLYGVDVLTVPGYLGVYE